MLPSPLPLAIAGSALEFVPVAGWIIAAATMLGAGWLAHAHWILMAAAILGWRGVQNFVISPRVMGDRLQMEPALVLFALMVGGQIGGVAGVILSVPAVAIFRIVRHEGGARDAASPVALVKSSRGGTQTAQS